MKSALFIRGGAIGDFVLVLPAICAFRARFPGTRIEVMGYSHIAELVNRRFYAEAVRSLDHRDNAIFFADRGKLNENLSRYFASFDLIVSYLFDPDRIFETNLGRAGAQRIIVADGRPGGMLDARRSRFDKGMSRGTLPGEISPLDPPAREDLSLKNPIHASEHLARWLPQLGMPLQVGNPELFPNLEDQSEALRLFPLLKKPTVALHPGSGSPSKNWPPTRFAELAKWLREKEFEVLVLTGPADSEAETQFWKDPRSKGCVRCHWQALPLVAAILKECKIFVGHDSGISHIAAAVDVPTLALFGATEPQVWAPRGKSVKVIKKGQDISLISIEDVKEEIDRLLG